MRDKMSEEREREMVDLLRFENGDFALPLNKTYFTGTQNETASFVFLTGLICFKISKYCIFRSVGIPIFVKRGNFFRNDCTL
jgi:hypothetical protein